MEIKECFWPWFEAFIHVNGDLKPCCYARTAAGNLFVDGSIEDIWNGPVMNELREYVAANRLHRVCVGASCPYISDAISDTPSSSPADQVEFLRAIADSGSMYTLPLVRHLLATGDQEEALRYLRLAAERRNPSAQYFLALYHLDQGERPEARAEGVRLLRTASDMKDGLAIGLLGRILSDPDSPEFDVNAARDLLREAGQLGNARAFLRLAEMYRDGLFGQPDLAEYERYLAIAVKRGAIAGQLGLPRDATEGFPSAITG